MEGHLGWEEEIIEAGREAGEALRKSCKILKERSKKAYAILKGLDEKTYKPL